MQFHTIAQRVRLAVLLLAAVIGMAYAVHRARAVNEIIQFGANPTTCTAPCSPNISWITGSENIVTIYRSENGSTPDFHSNQARNGDTTDFDLPAGTYVYILHVINNNWQDVAQSNPVTVTVNAPSFTPQLSSPSAQTVGQTPTYVITGGKPNTQVCWQVNGMGAGCNGTTNAAGSLQIAGGTWTTAGSYSILATVGGDVTNTITVTVSAACTPTTCAAQGKNCGIISNGCGDSLNCGTCTY